MLEGELIEVQLNGLTIKHYESLGYSIPKSRNSHGRVTVRRGTRLLVKVSDLPPNSAQKVTRICKACSLVSKIPFHLFTDTCNACSLKSRSGGKHPNWKGGRPCIDCGTTRDFSSKRCRACHDKTTFGSGNNNYNPNKTQRAKTKDRKHESVQWSKSVKERDNFTCRCCKVRGTSDLHSHHLNSWADHPSERLSVENGVTLCKKCHFGFHNTYGRRYNTVAQFNEYLANKGSFE
jgi:hypothetical protein